MQNRAQMKEVKCAKAIPKCANEKRRLICSMDYPKFIVSNQKEESISIQRVNIFLSFFCLLVSSADNLCKQFGPRSGPTKHQA